jgi:hypothetical protein
MGSFSERSMAFAPARAEAFKRALRNRIASERRQPRREASSSSQGVGRAAPRAARSHPTQSLSQPTPFLGFTTAAQGFGSEPLVLVKTTFPLIGGKDGEGPSPD